MHTGYYFGTLLASVANYTIGTHWGWRAMFVLGGTPALLVAFVRYGVREPARWTKRAREMGQRLTARSALAGLFSQEYRGRTLLNASYVLISMVGLWAGSAYVPSAVTQTATCEAQSLAASAEFASIGSVLLSLGTIVGCLLVPALAGRGGRRFALGFFYLLMALSVLLSFGNVFSLREHVLTCFMSCLFFIGVGGASFCVFTVWLPEQYRTERLCVRHVLRPLHRRGRDFCRWSGDCMVGYARRPVAATGLVFVAGLALLPFGVETRGKTLEISGI
jgi:predicted MFS family arabinose efflux permease